MADRFGAKRVFRLAIVIFTLASAACGLADSLHWFGGTPLYYQPPPISERLAKMSAVDRDAIVDVAGRVLAPDRLCLAAVGTLSRARLGELRKTVDAWR